MTRSRRTCTSAACPRLWTACAYACVSPETKTLRMRLSPCQRRAHGPRERPAGVLVQGEPLGAHQPGRGAPPPLGRMLRVSCCLAETAVRSNPEREEEEEEAEEGEKRTCERVRRRTRTQSSFARRTHGTHGLHVDSAPMRRRADRAVEARSGGQTNVQRRRRDSRKDVEVHASMRASRPEDGPAPPPCHGSRSPQRR